MAGESTSDSSMQLLPSISKSSQLLYFSSLKMKLGTQNNLYKPPHYNFFFFFKVGEELLMLW